jgi:hypothetical protein
MRGGASGKVGNEGKEILPRSDIAIFCGNNIMKTTILIILFSFLFLSLLSCLFVFRAAWQVHILLIEIVLIGNLWATYTG